LQHSSTSETILENIIYNKSMSNGENLNDAKGGDF